MIMKKMVNYITMFPSSSCVFMTNNSPKHREILNQKVACQPKCFSFILLILLLFKWASSKLCDFYDGFCVKQQHLH